MTDAIKTLPKQGFDAQTILHTMQELRGDDAAWSEGKCWALVYSAGEEVTDVLRQAFSMFLTENALNPTAFPSLKQMEAEVVAMTGHLLGGDAQTTGSMTTGGTESILMAMKTAKMWAKNTSAGCAPPRSCSLPPLTLPLRRPRITSASRPSTRPCLTTTAWTSSA